MILARVWTPLLQVGHSPLQSLGTKDRKMITQVTPRVRGMVTPPSPGGNTTGGIDDVIIVITSRCALVGESSPYRKIRSYRNDKRTSIRSPCSQTQSPCSQTQRRERDASSSS